MKQAKLDNEKGDDIANLVESNFGTRDERGHYYPSKRVGYPPIFVWPLQPVRSLKWILSMPGYFLPWNSLYIIIGILIGWFIPRPKFIGNIEIALWRPIKSKLPKPFDKDFWG